MSILSSSTLGGQSKAVDVNHDPTTTNTDVPGGTLINYYTTPTDAEPVHQCTFIKLTDGNNTDVIAIGCYRNYEENNTQATTTSTTPQLIFTSTFTPTIAADYIIDIEFEWGAEKKDKSHIVRIDLDDSPIKEFEQYMGGEDDNADVNIPSTMRTVKPLTAAPHTLKMYLSSGEAGKEVFVNDKTFIVKYWEN